MADSHVVPPSIRNVCVAGFACLVLGLPCPARAESDLLSLSLEELMNLPVKTATRVDVPLRKTPAYTQVITRDQIDIRGYESLLDLLSDLPSTDVQTRDNEIFDSRVAVRGIAGNNKLIVLRDGVRISSPTSENLPIGEYLSLYGVDKVEIIYGPASALYGADAFAGVINLISRDVSQPDVFRARLTGGDNDYRRVAFQVEHLFDNGLQVALSGHRHKDDHEDLASSYPEYFALNDLKTFDGDVVRPAEGRSGFIASEKTSSFNIGVDYQQFTAALSVMRDSHSTALGVLPDRTDYESDPQLITQVTQAHADYKMPFTKTLDSLVSLQYLGYEIDPDSRFVNVFSDFNNAYKYASSDRMQLEQQFNYWQSKSHNLVFGYELGRYEVVPRTADLPYPFDAETPGGTQQQFYLGTNNTPVKTFNLRYDAWGAYLQSLYDWNDSFQTVFGLRHDDNDSYGSSTNLRAGLIFTWQKATTFKLLYGEAFLAPSQQLIHEHFGSFAFQDSDGLYHSYFMHVPNTNLKPEELKSIELNIEHQFTADFMSTVAIYRNELDGLIQNAAPEQVDHYYIPGGYIESTQFNDNLGEGTLNGIDVILDYRQHAGSYLFDVWSSLSYVDGELEQDDFGQTPFPHIANKKFKLGFSVAKQSWSLALKNYWYGATYPLSVVTDDNETHAGCYWLSHLYATYTLNRNLAFQFNVKNLFDTKYYNSGLGGEQNLEKVPQEGRRFYASVEYRYH